VGQLGERGEYWMGRRMCGLIWNLELHGGSPHLCWLRLNEQALECTNAYGTYGISKLSSFVCHQVGRYLISLWILYRIVSGHPRCVCWGIRVEDGTRVRKDPAWLFDRVVNYCHSWCPPILHVSCCQVYTLARLTTDSNLRDTLRYGWWLVRRT
jgi:hypothetical protein